MKTLTSESIKKLLKTEAIGGIIYSFEEVGSPNKVDFVIVGIGVNINMTREMMEREMGEVSEIATSLREALGYDIKREKFASDLIEELEIWYHKFLKEGKPRIIKEWMERWG